MSTEHETAAILRVLAHMELPDDRGGPTVWADGTLTLPAGHYWGIAAEVVATVQGGRYWDTAAEVYRAAGGEGPEAEVTRLREELDRLNAGRQRLQEEHDEYVRRTDREVYASLRECEYVRAVLDRVRVAIGDGEPLETVRGMIAATPLDLTGPRSSMRASVESDAWCDYWQAMARVACEQRDEALATVVGQEQDIGEATQLLDTVIADGKPVEDSGEPDQPAELTEAARLVVERLRHAEDTNRRLSREIARLRSGEMPLPGAPELTAGSTS